MKRFMFFVLAAAIAVIPATTYGWIRIYGEADRSEEGLSVQQTTDGGYIAVGYTRPQGNFETSDLWLLKTDSLGDTVWTQTYGGEFDDAGSCVRQTSDGGYIITGSTQSYSTDTTHELWLIKTDAAGDEMWSQRYAGPPGIGECIEETDEGGYIITGRPWTLMKTDSQGDTTWTRIYEGLWGHFVEQTSDSGYIVTGYDHSSSWPDLWLLKSDPQGDSLWTKAYDTILWHEGECIRPTPDEGLIVAGWASDDIGGWSTGTQMWILRTDEFGDTVWSFLSAWEGGDRAESVDLTDDGGYIVVGLRQAEGLGPEDLWLLKFNDEGDTLWTRTYSEEDYLDAGYEVQQTEDGGYIITGYTSDGSSVDLWLIKTDEEGYAGDCAVSATAVISPDLTDGPPTMFAPEAYFTNLGDMDVGDFWCHCDIISVPDPDRTYHDSVMVDDILRIGDSIMVGFNDWIKGEPDRYDLTFYTTKEIEGWQCEPLVVHLNYGTGVCETSRQLPSWELVTTCGTVIVLNYSGYAKGFHADIFDASGCKVDEIKSSSCSGIVTWGECYGPGVYFIVPRIGVEWPRKVILIR